VLLHSQLNVEVDAEISYDYDHDDDYDFIVDRIQTTLSLALMTFAAGARQSVSSSMLKKKTEVLSFSMAAQPCKIPQCVTRL